MKNIITANEVVQNIQKMCLDLDIAVQISFHSNSGVSVHILDTKNKPSLKIVSLDEFLDMYSKNFSTWVDNVDF